MLAVMTRRLLIPVLAALAILPGQAMAAQGRTAATVDGSYVVVYGGSAGDPSTETSQRERAHGFKAKLRYRHAVEGFAARLTPAQVRRLQADPEVAAVVPDRRVHASETLVPGDSAPLGVRRIGAATTTTTRGAANVNVAVIDSGVDLAHPDLHVVSGVNCVTPGAAAQDDNGHGTHVAGSIAARNNGRGVVGVAAGTRVYSVKVLDATGGGTMSQVICGIDWVTSTRTDSDPANDVRVANMSLGGVGSPVRTCADTTDPEHRAICRSTAGGVVYAVAAGNSGWDFDYAPAPDTPAAYPEVVTVSAIGDSDGRSGASGPAPSCRSGEADDRYASVSNFAATAAGRQHTLAAPGVCINSTARGGGYATMSGTSMATPHVAGALALCISDGSCTGIAASNSPAFVQKLVSTTASYGFAGDPSRPVSGRYYGYLTWAGGPGSSPAPTVTSVSAAPSTATVQTGSLRAGSAGSLSADDGYYFQANSTTSYTRATSWQGRFASVPRTLSNLRVSYKGLNSRTCAQTVSIYRWSDATWVTLDSRSVGTTQVGLSGLIPPGSAPSYVSGGGEIAVRIACSTTSGSFISYGNLLRISYDRPA
jgi:subtilisin